MAVEALNVDATSFRQLVAAHGTPAEVAAAIARIVSARGKLHNPATGSGGVLVGRLTSSGPAREGDPPPGSFVIPLASLVATPLLLEDVGPVCLESPQVPVRGRAIVTGRMACAPVPDDLPLEVVLTAIDVYPAASHTRSLAKPGDHVLVVGCGHAGLAALVAAREAVGRDGIVTAVDAAEGALSRARSLDEAAVVIRGDATAPNDIAREFSSLGLPPADLTVLCTTVPGCEGTGILLTAGTGTVLFFSTATSFQAAALGADSLSQTVQLAIPNGYTPDRGSYLLDVLRRTPRLLQMFRSR